MNYAIVIPDGCADEPQAELAGRTPLAAANTPAMDALAEAGIVGRANHVPPHLPAGSDVANMSLLGYDPDANFTGRAPLEAAAQGIELGPDDWAVRCNLVTIEDQVMRDFTAGHIDSEAAAQLLQTAQQHLGDDTVTFIPGVSYRNLLIWRGTSTRAPFTEETRTTPPHDLTDQTVLDNYPKGPGSDVLHRLMSESTQLFRDHPVNAARRGEGHLPATNIWLWGQGRAPRLAAFADVYQKRGAMITAVDLLRGLAALIGWDRIEVPGATGYTDTDYAAKGRYAIEALNEYDVVCVHVEAPDEASHEGDCAAKVAALEAIDEQIVAPLLDALKKRGEWRMLVTPDHPTPLRTKTHSHGAVPFVIAGSNVTPDGNATYADETAAESELAYEAGWKLMEAFLAE